MACATGRASGQAGGAEKIKVMLAAAGCALSAALSVGLLHAMHGSSACAQDSPLRGASENVCRRNRFESHQSCLAQLLWAAICQHLGRYFAQQADALGESQGLECQSVGSGHRVDQEVRGVGGAVSPRPFLRAQAEAALAVFGHNAPTCAVAFVSCRTDRQQKDCSKLHREHQSNPFGNPIKMLRMQLVLCGAISTVTNCQSSTENTNSLLLKDERQQTCSTCRPTGTSDRLLNRTDTLLFRTMTRQYFSVQLY